MLEAICNYEDVIDSDPCGLIVADATFKTDFGPWCKGDRVKSLTLAFNESKLTEWSSDGKVVKTCKVKLIADWQRE